MFRGEGDVLHFMWRGCGAVAYVETAKRWILRRMSVALYLA